LFIHIDEQDAQDEKAEQRELAILSKPEIVKYACL
jgi:hypothetical protein